MRELVAGAWFQVAVMRRNRHYWLEILTNPLLAVVFIAIVRDAGRPDLLGHAVLAPALMGVWRMALGVSGETIESDRFFGVLEPALTTGGSYATATVGRIAAVTLISLIAFAESWLVAWALFGVVVPIPHPIAFTLAVLTTAIAATGTSVLMATVFTAARSARTFQNSLSYPFYVLGGVIVPVSLLPEWVQPITRIVFLSWSSDLLRASLQPVPVDDLWLRAAVIVGLGVAGFLGGSWLMHRVFARLKRLGTVKYA